MSTDPAALLRALADALFPHLADRLGTSARRAFSQRNGERPVGAGRARYLRVWKRAHEAGDEGAWEEGRARLMTADSWTRWARVSAVRGPATGRGAERTPDEEALALLGARPTRAGGAPARGAAIARLGAHQRRT